LDSLTAGSFAGCSGATQVTFNERKFGTTINCCAAGLLNEMKMAGEFPGFS
jgi:hypothetical protein